MFSRRWLINYLLFILIIIFTWIGMKYPSISEQQPAASNSITGLAASDIERIRIETADWTIQLQKQGSRWMLNHPVQWFANNVTVERLASLASLQPQSTLPRQDIDLSTLGLSLPRAVVSLNDTNVYFGDTNQIGNRRYLLVDDHVYLASDVHHPFIGQGLAALIDNRLLPASLGMVALQSKSFALRHTGNTWVSDNTGHAAEAIQRLITHWQTRAAASIKPYNQSLTPLHKITAQTTDAGTIEFYLLSIKPEIILARPDLDVQFHFPDYHYYDLLSLEQKDE